jgi:hypothetical protein
MTLPALPILLLVAALISAGAGFFGGVRYANGRAAVERLEALEQQRVAASGRLEAARTQQKDAVAQIAAAGVREAALRNRQLKEQVRYVEVIKLVPAPVDCRITATELGLLDALAARTRADRGDAAGAMPDALRGPARAAGDEHGRAAGDALRVGAAL